MSTAFQALITATALTASLHAPSSMAADARSMTQYLEVEDGHIAYDDTGGTGSVVVAVPGMGDLRSQYRYLRPYLTEAGFRVVTMDVRGQGESSVSWSDYSAQATGRDVLALINKLDSPSAIVIGNSFAAGAALWAAHKSPERIRGTVLIGPVLHDMPASPVTQAILKVGMSGPWRTWFWTTYWNSLFPSRKPVDHQERRALLASNLKQPGRYEALKTMVNLSKAETETILGQVQVPTMIVMGLKDADFPEPAQEAQYIGSRLRASTVLVDDAGHYPHTEMPEIVNPKIVAFAQKLN